jgi:hypothetical protein
MRTKALLIAAAMAAGAATSMAQSNVYSLNIVGYVNYTQPANTFRLGANPLNLTNNDVSFVFSSAPNYAGLTIYKRNSSGTGYDQSDFDPDLVAWTGPLDVSPGSGLWIATPAGTPFTNTYVGEVKLSSSLPMPAGFSLLGSVVPDTGLMQTTDGLPGAAGDAIYFQNSSATGYDQYSFDPDVGFWTPVEPTNQVARGFWYFNAGATKNWVRNFSVGP